MPYQTARWVVREGRASRRSTHFKAENRGSLAEDRDGRLVFLARNAWELDNIAKRYPGHRLPRHLRAGRLKSLRTSQRGLTKRIHSIAG